MLKFEVYRIGTQEVVTSRVEITITSWKLSKKNLYSGPSLPLVIRCLQKLSSELNTQTGPGVRDAKE